MAEEQQGGFYRVEVIASLFGVTVRRVQQLTQEGIISTTKTKEVNEQDRPNIVKVKHKVTGKEFEVSRKYYETYNQVLDLV